MSSGKFQFPIDWFGVCGNVSLRLDRKHDFRTLHTFTTKTLSHNGVNLELRSSIGGESKSNGKFVCHGSVISQHTTTLRADCLLSVFDRCHGVTLHHSVPLSREFFHKIVWENIWHFLGLCYLVLSWRWCGWKTPENRGPAPACVYFENNWRNLLTMLDSVI